MFSVAVMEQSQVAEARRTTVALARRHGFDDEAAGRVALVTTELATNLVKHGGGGHLISTSFDDHDGTTGIEIIAIDKGPGISDVAMALSDGTSTSGTAGNGLGAIKRQSHAFDIFSQSGHGTIVISRILAKRVRAFELGDSERFPSWGAVCVPMQGEDVSGDAWAVRSDDTGRTLMVVDGLGHGPEAAKVASEATRLFDKYWRVGPAETLKSLHAGLRATRGGAIAIARIEPESRRIVYAGIGNISGALVCGDGQIKRLMSYNGTLGYNARRFQDIIYTFDRPEDATVVMHSDGVSASWSPTSFPRLLVQRPALLSAVLYRNFARGRDDATVLVSRALAT